MAGPGWWQQVTGCHLCPAVVAWDTAVVFERGPVELRGPDAPIVTMRGSHVVVCTSCAALVLRRDVAGILARSAVTWASEATRSEAAALTLRFLDAVGPPLDGADWLAARHA